MSNPAEQFAAAQQANLEAFEGAISKAFAGAEKLVELNLAAILDMARRLGVWLISDEVYSRLVYDGSAAAPSLLDIARPDDRVMVCNSFSKTWIMTGWRLGWLLVPEALIEAATRRAFVRITASR